MSSRLRECWSNRRLLDLYRADRDELIRLVLAQREALAALGGDDLPRTVDLGWLGHGQPPLRWVIDRFVIGHADAHLGEISCVKGLQGLQGYGF